MKSNHLTFYKVRNSFELLYLLVCKELKIRYAHSFLGYLWTLLIPIAFIGTYYVSFKLVMRVPRQDYVSFLATGMFPWLWILNGIVQAAPIYRSNLSLVKKVNLQRAILPLSIVAKEMLHYLFALPIMLVFVLWQQHNYFWSWFWLAPIMLILQLLFIYAIAMIAALTQVFIRDVEFAIGIIMNIIFFMTPIIYPISMVPERYQSYFALNPFAAFIETWRSIWLTGSLGSLPTFTLCCIYTLAAGSIAYIYYKKVGKNIGEWL